MALASKKLTKSQQFRRKVNDTSRWFGKMKKRRKLRKQDLDKIRRYKERSHRTREVEGRLVKLTDDLSEGRRLNAEWLDELAQNYGVEASSSSEDEDIKNVPSTKRMKLESPSRVSLSGCELEDKYANANFASAVQDDENNIRHLLPVKTSGGKIYNVAVPVIKKEEESAETLDEQENAAESSDIDEHKSTTPASVLDHGSVAVLFASRLEIVNNYKQRIASLSCSIMENPQEHVNMLKSLLEMARGEGVEPLVQITVMKLATASILEIFLDILPSYKIRLWTEEEQKQQMKKETRRLHQYEQALLRHYQKYISHLNALCKSFRTRKLYKMKISPTILSSFSSLAIKALCRLLADHHYFNFRSEILDCLVPLINTKVPEMSLICESVEGLFSSDISGEASLDAVKAICRFIKDNTAKTHPRMLATFLRLKIKNVEKREQKEKSRRELLAKKQKIRLMSRKEKKMNKRLKKLDEDLHELEAEENENTILKNHTKTMDQVFGVYFRILKQRLPHAMNSKTVKLLSPVLEGLSKFAHLINVEFFDDLIASLLQLTQSGKLYMTDSLLCVKTAFIILSGEGQALNIDPYGFYRYVYSIIPKVAIEKNLRVKTQQLSLCLECLDYMLNRRRKQVPYCRVASFVKRLLILMVKFERPLSTAILLSIKSFFTYFPKLEEMIDDEFTGTMLYSADIDDPDRSNAQATSLLDDLKKIQTTVGTEKLLIRHFLAKLPVHGPSSLPPNLLSKIPWSLLDSSSSNGV